MNNNEKSPKPRKRNMISFSLVRDAVKNIHQHYLKSQSKTFNSTNLYDANLFFIDDIENFTEYISKGENIFLNLLKIPSKSIYTFYHHFKYIQKLISSKKTIKLKQNDFIGNSKKTKSLINIILFLLRQYINDNNHKQIQNMLIYLIFLSSENILPSNTYLFIIEVFIEVLIDIIKSNSKMQFSLKEDPFLFINDIIEAIIHFPQEIAVNNPDNYIIIEIINLFDNYLFKPNYNNIDFFKSSIWLKLIGNHLINPVSNILLTNSHKINKTCKNKNDIISSEILSFLIKIYKYKMPDEYFSHTFIQKSTIDLFFYSNSLNYLRNLFKEEDKSKSSNDFKIKKGFFIPEESAISINNLKYKMNEYSVIFSFRLDKICNNNENVILFNLFYKSEKDKEKTKILLCLSIDNISHNLFISNSNDKKWDTGINIALGKDYFACLTQRVSILKSVLRIYINETLKPGEENHIKRGKVKGSDNFYFFGVKTSYPDFQKEITLELGKNNFSGVMGDFLIINKKLNKKNIQYLINIKGNYSEILTNIYKKYSFIDHSNNIINNINNFGQSQRGGLDENIKFFKLLEYEIKLEIMTYRLKQNKFQIIQNFNSYDITDINNNEDDIQLYELKFSSMKFYQEKGIEFLIFQLHNITSILGDNQLINIYLYKTISFIYDLILNLNEILVDTTVRQAPKIDHKIIIFFLTLLTILNKKKGKITLDNNNQSLLLELLDYIRFNNIFVIRNILVSILLDENIFESKKNYDIIQKIISSLVSDLTDNSNNDISLICHEFLYKILLHDYIYETKEIKHKPYMRLISSFINVEHYKKNDSLSKIQPNIIEVFIKYLLGIKSENKIYHYLKIIFINSKKMKEKLIENGSFFEYINMKMEKINTSHCQYCLYIQILCYLINEEIYINSTNENDYCFHFNPSGFMKSPNFSFIKCIFIQCFNISNESKLKFIKSKLKGIEFLRGMKDYTDVVILINDIKFIPKFKAVVDYIKFLYNEQQNSNNDTRLIGIIKDTINLFVCLLDEVFFPKKEVDPNNKIYQNFIQELLQSEGMKIFYSLYLSINQNKALVDIKKKISISVRKIFNAFYFFLFSTSVFFDDDINGIEDCYEENDNPDSNGNNQQIKTKLLDMLTNNLINQKIYKDKNDIILVQNNTLLLIYIYQNIINNKISLTEDIEKNTILFINYILDNNFINSKYAFDLNSSPSVTNNNNPNPNATPTDSKEQKNYKFLPELIFDILFILYDYRKYDLKYNYLIRRLCNSRDKSKKSNFFLIDKQHFVDNKNRTLFYRFYNENFFENICNAVQVSEIMYTIYFLFLLLDKKHKYTNLDTEPLKLLDDIILILFNDIVQLYNEHFPKITMVKKNVLSKYPYKMYKYFLIYIENKYKDKAFSVDKLSKYYLKLIKNKDILMQRKSHLLSEEFLSTISLSNSINNEVNNRILNSKGMGEELRLTVLNKNSLNKMKNNDFLLAKKEEKERNKSLPQVNMRLLRIKMQEMLEEKSNQLYYDKPTEIKINPETKSYSTKNILQGISNRNKNSSSNNINIINDNIDKDKDNDNENNNKNIPSSIFKSGKKKTNKKVQFNFNDTENNPFHELSPSKQIEERTSDDNENNNNKTYTNIIVPSEDFLPRSSSKTLTKKDIKVPKAEAPKEIDFFATRNDSNKDDFFKANDSSSDDNSEEMNIEEYDLQKKLNKLNIPSIHYKNYFHLSDQFTTKILVNPKEYFIWKLFTLVFKDFIYNNKKFSTLKKTYYSFFRKLSLTKTENYYLNYPTKLKNFICDDYYRPFLKADLNFFRHKLIANTHSYIDKTVLYKQYCDEDKFYNIRFERLIPINYDIKNKSRKIICESINNKGSIYGNIYFNHAFMIFISNTYNDPRNDKAKMNEDEQLMLFYLYSYFEEERLKDRNKFIIIYFEEIKEIIIRRFCYNYVGYEIFTKDHKSFLFNFFNKKNMKDFVSTIKKYSNLSKKKNSVSTSNSMNELSGNAPILHIMVSNEINFNIINDPLIVFEKNEYKQKYLKGEITNFKYLLLLNKYSSRSYKDNNQYLIFPLLHMDTAKKIKRDLSKAICLNKKNCDIQTFLENFKFTGCNFNNHYSSSAYILFYLVRLIPFTFNHLKLQGGQFDSPERIFSSFDNFLFVLSNSDENRELCPELFCNYEPFINLNFFNLGFIHSDKVQINDFTFDNKQGIIQFIISERQLLEASQLSQWIDNIFGVNQIGESPDSLNMFPLSSYEQLNNFEEEKRNKRKKGLSTKEIYAEIKQSINLLTMGITPVQIFKTSHPNKGTSNNQLKKSFSSTLNTNNMNNSLSTICINTINSNDNPALKKKKSNSIDNIYQFITNTSNNDYLLFSINNDNNNYGPKFISILSELIYVYRLNFEENKNIGGLLKFENRKKQIKIEPYSNICCELIPGIFCFCRYIDNSLEIKSDKFTYAFKWKCLITSVEFFTQTFSDTATCQKNDAFIFFGDEKGYLNLIKIEIESGNKKQVNNINIGFINQVKTHNSYIKGIIYNQRLNIVISFDNNQITIINAYSFDILNIIELGEKYEIYNIKLSDYDLLFVSCFNKINGMSYIKSFTLNGVKGSKLKTKSSIVNFFICDDVIIVVYLENKIEMFTQYNLKDQYLNCIEPCSNEGKNKIHSNIMFCDFNPKNMKLFIIYFDKQIISLDIMVTDDN